VKLFLKNFLFTLLIEGTVSVYAPLAIARGKSVVSNLLLVVVGSVLLLLGFAIYTWTVWNFASFGRGTPLPLDAPRRLVVRGLYRYTRNPMYVGVLLVVLGWAGIFGDAWLLLYTLGVLLLIHLFVIIYEEPHLKRQLPFWYKNKQSM
jgi:protein-S-isoprenylcysteine O-methyltransferase Ste14